MLHTVRHPGERAAHFERHRIEHRAFCIDEFERVAPRPGLPRDVSGRPSATSVFAKRCGVTITSVRTAGTLSDEPSAVRTLTQPLKS